MIKIKSICLSLFACITMSSLMAGLGQSSLRSPARIWPNRLRNVDEMLQVVHQTLPMITSADENYICDLLDFFVERNKGFTAVIRALINKAIELNLSRVYDSFNLGNYLIWACEKSDLETVKYLLEELPGVLEQHGYEPINRLELFKIDSLDNITHIQQ